MKSLAKVRSLPAMPSASTMQASLPLWMIAPCSRSSTETLLLSAANMVEPPDGAPPLRQAFSLTRYSSVSLISPCLMAWNTTSAVISFSMLDGARSSSAFFSNSTLPLAASIRIAVGASASNPPSSFLAPCTLLIGGRARSRPSRPPPAQPGRDQAAPEACCEADAWSAGVRISMPSAMPDARRSLIASMRLRPMSNS